MGPKQQSAFDVAKEQLSSDSLLAHYDMNKDLILSCDASSYGVGAVLSHLMENGDERPVAYASRSLSSAEKRYSQLDREALALVFGVTRFRQYLLGRQFKLLTDHKPLIHLFGESRGIPTMASARLQRWALTLSGYDYKIVYKSGKELCNADGLSRLPLPDSPSTVPLPGETVLLLECLQHSPVTWNQIKNWTARDPLLSQVYLYTMQGWPRIVENDLLPYFRKKDEISTEGGCLLWGC